MKSIIIIRWCLVAICAASLAACTTTSTGKDSDHSQPKKDGWHSPGWINT